MASYEELFAIGEGFDAFVSHDVAKAEGVLKSDDEIDRALVQVFEELRGEMHRDSASINRAISTLFFAKNLERMADHTTNVAEMVVYLVRGQDVRHRRNSEP